jgi:hypothetical protein
MGVVFWDFLRDRWRVLETEHLLLIFIPDDINVKKRDTDKLSKSKTWRFSSAGCGK